MTEIDASVTTPLAMGQTDVRSTREDRRRREQTQLGLWMFLVLQICLIIGHKLSAAA